MLDPKYENYSSPLDFVSDAAAAAEFGWFMETYYPRYDIIMSIGRDLLNDAYNPDVPQYGPVSASGGSLSGQVDTGERVFGVNELAEKHGVPIAWVRDHVLAMLRGPEDSAIYRRAMTQAAIAYGRDLSWQHPLMCTERIRDRINEFVPWFTLEQVQMLVLCQDVILSGGRKSRRAIKALSTPERKRVAIRVGAMRRRGEPEEYVQTYMDECSIAIERKGKYEHEPYN